MNLYTCRLSSEYSYYIEHDVKISPYAAALLGLLDQQ